MPENKSLLDEEWDYGHNVSGGRTVFKTNEPYRNFVVCECFGSDAMELSRAIKCLPQLLRVLKSARQLSKFEHHPFRPWHKEADDILEELSLEV